MPPFPAATARTLAFAQGRNRVCVSEWVLNSPLGSQTTVAIQEKREAQPFITTTCTNEHIHHVMKELN